MLLSTAFSVFLIAWSVLYLIDYALRNWQVGWYLQFVVRHNLVVSPFQIRFYWQRFDNYFYYKPFENFQTWTATSLRITKAVEFWFTLGSVIALLFFLLMPLYLCWLLFTEIFNWMYILQLLSSGPLSSIRVNQGQYEHVDLNNVPQNTITYVPFHNQVQTGLVPIVPGVNIPISHLPMFIFVLVIAGILHELGHAFAALIANVRVNGFGLFLFGIYVGAFTELDTEELNRASLAQRLRIYCAGILHNLALALVGLFILWTLPYLMFPLYTRGAGVLVKEIEPSSGLTGPTGFTPGHLITGINGCKVRNSSDWINCLENVRQHGSNTGYVMKQANVVQMIATPEFVKQYGDEIQCCEGFSNQTFASHLCFNYFYNYVTNRPLNEESYHKSAPAPPLNATETARVQESFGLFGRNLSIAEFGHPRNRRAINAYPKQTMTTETTKLGGNITHTKLNYACLSARVVTGQTRCLPGVSRLEEDSVCVMPCLYNGTQLLAFEINHGKETVLFVGPVTEPLLLVRVSDIVPRYKWVCEWIPDVVELFGQYLLTFSLALGLLNAVPCYGLDGQFICHTVIEFFCAKRSQYVRNRMANFIIFICTLVFFLNLIVGFVKLYLSFMR